MPSALLENIFTGLRLKDSSRKMQTNLDPLKGKIVEFNVANGVGRGYLSVPQTSRGGVIVLHAWWGLNDFFKSFVDRLAAEGYTAFAPDLREGKVAKTVDEAKENMKKENPDLIEKTVLASHEYLHAHPSVKGRKIGVVGFSMGAALALWLSTKKPDVAAATVFYGVYAVDFSKSEASYLGHFAPNDEWEPEEGIRSVEEKIRHSGRPVTFHTYPGTKHWFFENDRPEYSPQAAQLAWTRTLEFIHSTLGR